LQNRKISIEKLSEVDSFLIVFHLMLREMLKKHSKNKSAFLKNELCILTRAGEKSSIASKLLIDLNYLFAFLKVVANSSLILQMSNSGIRIKIKFLYRCMWKFRKIRG